MDKRYQVFVSSTFLDLQEERQEVMFTLMKMDCFPAGMELFPTADEEQWDYITKAIDQSDYYVIIVGARYGSLATGENISYTEKEFDYAVEIGKTVLVLLHKDPNSLSISKADEEIDRREALKKFREKLQTGRLVDYWTSAADLGGKVALGLIQAIKSRPAQGWVRGNEYLEQGEEVSNLLKTNLKLREKLEEIQRKEVPITINSRDALAGLSDEVELKFVGGKVYNPTNALAALGDASSEIYISQENKTVEFSEIFKILGRLIEINSNSQNLRESLSAILVKKLHIRENFILSKDSYDQVILQFRALNLIFLEEGSFASNSPSLLLTDKGEEDLLLLLALRKKE